MLGAGQATSLSVAYHELTRPPIIVELYVHRTPSVNALDWTRLRLPFVDTRTPCLISRMTLMRLEQAFDEKALQEMANGTPNQNY